MAKDNLRNLVAECIEDQIGDLLDLPALLEARFPELVELRGGPPGQPCDTEFTTVGKGNNANRTGFNTAYRQARNLAQTICNTGNCRRVTFLRYAQAELVTNKWRLEVVWKCEGAA